MTLPLAAIMHEFEDYACMTVNIAREMYSWCNEYSHMMGTVTVIMRNGSIRGEDHLDEFQ